ncbi:MAG: hypothetical protein ABL949_02935 [Fimbriimonadaceae bacterium]
MTLAPHLYMLYFTPPQLRAFFRRWAIFKALISIPFMLLPWITTLEQRTSVTGIFEPMVTAILVFLGVCTWMWGAGDYSKSKGYSAWLGLLASPVPFGPFGFAILFIAPDRWSPKHLDWSFEASNNMVDGVLQPNSRDARAALVSSAKQKLVISATSWFIVGLNEVLLSARLESSATKLASWLLILVAAIAGLWGAANLARSKGYSPFVAVSGFAFIPYAYFIAMQGAYQSSIGMALAAVWLGPIVLLVMPDVWRGTDRSPLTFNPNLLGEVPPEPEMVMNQVRWVN